MKINKITLGTILKRSDITVMDRKKITTFVIFATAYLIKRKKLHGEDFVSVVIILYVTVVLISKLVRLLNHKKVFNNV